MFPRTALELETSLTAGNGERSLQKLSQKLKIAFEGFWSVRVWGKLVRDMNVSLSLSNARFTIIPDAFVQYNMEYFLGYFPRVPSVCAGTADKFLNLQSSRHYVYMHADRESQLVRRSNLKQDRWLEWRNVALFPDGLMTESRAVAWRLTWMVLGARCYFILHYSSSCCPQAPGLRTPRAGAPLPSRLPASFLIDLDVVVAFTS